MKLRGTLILLVIVILLLGVAYFIERNPKEDTKKSKNLGNILEVNAGDVNKFEIIYTEPQNATINYAKNSKGFWEAGQTTGEKSDHKSIQNLISSTMDKFIFNTVKNPENMAEYGLDKPRIIIIFHFYDRTSRKIMLGKTVPIGNYVYVKQESSTDIYMVPASIVEDFTKLNVK